MTSSLAPELMARSTSARDWSLDLRCERAAYSQSVRRPHVGQPVGAEHDDVSVQEGEALDVNLRSAGAGTSQRLGHDVMGIAHARGQVYARPVPAVLAFGGVVVGQLHQLVIAKDVRARMSDVHEEQLVPAV